ncbi:DUF6537 domain-containing protein [Streptomyces sp. NPDC097727]|uniref:DUF6537 domain-containing protein n=1 Tax=Streptomyces sp. NPDC097727 TaxID=3366092 RepID=UPI00380E01C6
MERDRPGDAAVAEERLVRCVLPVMRSCSCPRGRPSRGCGAWPWFKPAFQALAAMHRLRGTRLDAFGAARVRRTERALVVEYEATTEVCRNLDMDVHGLAVEIASLPDIVRGYEEIKMASVTRYRTRSAELVGRLGRNTSAPP